MELTEEKQTVGSGDAVMSVNNATDGGTFTGATAGSGSKVSTITESQTLQEQLGISDNTIGCAMLLLAAVVGAVDAIMYEIAEDDGVSSNAMTLWSNVACLIGGLLLDSYFCYFGYADGVHWFVLTDVWKEKQRDKIIDISGLWGWLVSSLSLNWIITVMLLASFIFVSDVGDAISIFDAYPVFIPVLGICIKTGRDWQHRYWICFPMIIVALLLLCEPGYLFGYDTDVDASDQVIGCLLAFGSAILTAFGIIAIIIVKKYAYMDLIQQKKHERQVQQLFSNSASGEAREMSEATETTPLKPVEKPKTRPRTNSALQRLTAGMDDTFVLDQSNEYIIQNDYALTILVLEYSSLISIIQCFLFWPFCKIQQNYADGGWFWDEMILFDSYSTEAVNYAVGASILYFVDYALYTFGLFKVANAPLAGILDISDVFFTYIFSYWWLDEEPDTYGLVGSILIVLSIGITLYPWHRHLWIPESF